MEKSKKSINLEDGFFFCGGWNFSKSVSVGSTFIREMRVPRTYCPKIYAVPCVVSFLSHNVGNSRLIVVF